MNTATSAAEVLPLDDDGPDDLTDDELRAVADEARAKHAQQMEPPLARYVAVPWEKGLENIDGALTDMLRAVGVNRGHVAAVDTAHRCAGGCHEIVHARGDWCAMCADRSRYVASDIALATAKESINPDGGRDWCRNEDISYRRAITGTPSEPGIKELYKALPDGERNRDDFNALFRRAEWNGGSMLLVGPTGIGKSALLAAIGNQMLDRARAGSLSREAFAVAAGIRWVSAIDIAKAASRHKLGEGEPPLLKMAKKASILILDELGKEDQRSDPHAIMELLRARYEPKWKPTFVASEVTLDELNRRYGASTMRTVWQRGKLIDLHPRSIPAT